MGGRGCRNEPGAWCTAAFDLVYVSGRKCRMYSECRNYIVEVAHEVIVTGPDRWQPLGERVNGLRSVGTECACSVVGDNGD